MTSQFVPNYLSSVVSVTIIKNETNSAHSLIASSSCNDKASPSPPLPTMQLPSPPAAGSGRSCPRARRARCRPRDATGFEVRVRDLSDTLSPRPRTSAAQSGAASPPPAHPLRIRIRLLRERRERRRRCIRRQGFRQAGRQATKWGVMELLAIGATATEHRGGGSWSAANARACWP